MIELTQEEKKFITEIFKNFMLHGPMEACEKTIINMKIILEKINKTDDKK